MRVLRVAASIGTLALVALLSAASAGGTAGAGGAGGTPATGSLQPPIQAPRSGPCVADPAFMRRNHMDYLKHERDATVHLGIRDPRTSLQACVACHASAQTGSVAIAKTDFCVSCHSYTAVKVDCFECHASKPQATAFVPLNHPHAVNAATRLTEQWRTVSAERTGLP